jgi:hypothetical protein
VTEEYACLVIGHSDDSGNLQGFLRKYGWRYGQDSVTYKGYYRDALLLALRDLPALNVGDNHAQAIAYDRSAVGIASNVDGRECR